MQALLNEMEMSVKMKAKAYVVILRENSPKLSAIINDYVKNITFDKPIEKHNAIAVARVADLKPYLNEQVDHMKLIEDPKRMKVC